MTEQKPPGTSWESWIEQQIRRAQEEGAFDHLPGAGKPLPDLAKGYDALWWVKQLVQREQISLLPPALELLRKVEAELAAIQKLRDEVAVRRRLQALNAEIAKVNASATEGPATRLGPLNVDEIVAEWRSRSSDAP
jgi:hypothetical protein